MSPAHGSDPGATASLVAAIETSSTLGGVALVRGDKVLDEVVCDVSRSASERLLVELDRICQEQGLAAAQIDGFAASLGPGSFTGLRVGLATIKTLAWSLGKPLMGVSSLHTLAAGLGSVEGLVAPTLDARRAEVYGAVFLQRSVGSLERLVEDTVMAPRAWADRLAELAKEHGGGPVAVFGSGRQRYPEAFAAFAEPAADAPAYPRPQTLARLGCALLAAGQTLDPLTAVPAYVRGHGAIPPKDLPAAQ